MTDASLRPELIRDAAALDRLRGVMFAENATVSRFVPIPRHADGHDRRPGDGDHE
jgi:hypothetical protein